MSSSNSCVTLLAAHKSYTVTLLFLPLACTMANEDPAGLIFKTDMIPELLNTELRRL